MNNRYPIYIISKGRWNRRQTVNTLESMDTPYKIVVEPKEYNEYAKYIDKNNIITTPINYSELNTGSIPVRNFVWELSIKDGYKKHWILDDNIESVERYNNNLKIPCKSIAPFIACEDFTDRYNNVGISGMNYASFCPASDGRPPLKFNTRVYSCLLIDNSLPFRWRGKYNEDTDLCLRVLKSGISTILFNAFLIGKRATMTQKGGNADIYTETDNRKEFAESLQNQHPDVTNVVRRFNRWHHKVDYSKFKNIDPKLKPEYLNDFGSNKINNYNMKLVKIK